jgi:hypothetical protein
MESEWKGLNGALVSADPLIPRIMSARAVFVELSEAAPLVAGLLIVAERGIAMFGAAQVAGQVDWACETVATQQALPYVKDQLLALHSALVEVIPTLAPALALPVPATEDPPTLPDLIWRTSRLVADNLRALRTAYDAAGAPARCPALVRAVLEPGGSAGRSVAFYASEWGMARLDRPEDVAQAIWAVADVARALVAIPRAFGVLLGSYIEDFRRYPDLVTSLAARRPGFDGLLQSAAAAYQACMQLSVAMPGAFQGLPGEIAGDSQAWELLAELDDMIAALVDSPPVG